MRATAGRDLRFRLFQGIIQPERNGWRLHWNWAMTAPDFPTKGAMPDQLHLRYKRISANVKRLPASCTYALTNPSLSCTLRWQAPVAQALDHSPRARGGALCRPAIPVRRNFFSRRISAVVSANRDIGVFGDRCAGIDDRFRGLLWYRRCRFRCDHWQIGRFRQNGGQIRRD